MSGGAGSSDSDSSTHDADAAERCQTPSDLERYLHHVYGDARFASASAARLTEPKGEDWSETYVPDRPTDHATWRTRSPAPASAASTPTSAPTAMSTAPGKPRNPRPPRSNASGSSATRRRSRRTCRPRTMTVETSPGRYHD